MKRLFKYYVGLFENHLLTILMKVGGGQTVKLSNMLIRNVKMQFNYDVNL